VRELAPQFGTSACCRVLMVPRSTVNYQSVERPEVDLGRLKATIQTMLVTFRGYGVHRMYVHLHGLGVAITRASVRRAYVEMGLLKRNRSRRVRTTDSRHKDPVYPDLVKGLPVEGPDHVWAADVTCFRTGVRFAYLALLMDIWTREIMGWEVACANDTALTLSALRMGLGSGRRPRVHHSDQGANYASKLYILEAAGSGTLISMTGTGRPQDNGFVERLNRTVKEEEVSFSEYRNLHEAKEGIAAYVRHYNDHRVHSSLGYKKPSEVFAAWVQQKQGGPP
jgi:putative transposase